jgi:hypothetical protein
MLLFSSIAGQNYKIAPHGQNLHRSMEKDLNKLFFTFAKVKTGV